MKPKDREQKQSLKKAFIYTSIKEGGYVCGQSLEQKQSLESFVWREQKQSLEKSLESYSNRQERAEAIVREFRLERAEAIVRAEAVFREFRLERAESIVREIVRELQQSSRESRSNR
jgi:hypothetical protein